MKRKDFIKAGGIAAAVVPAISVLKSCTPAAPAPENKMKSASRKKGQPSAITMWEFSWLERRWPGAGYEDWDLALDELAERGYDAVRIDPFPHLVAADPTGEWYIEPHWDTQDWGSPALNRVQIQPALNQFIRKCRDRNIMAGLSTWWRIDEERLSEKIDNPAKLAEVWRKTLDSIAADGLIDNILYVDLNNEFPIKVWTPYLPEGFVRNSPEGRKWMSEAIEILRKHYPDLKYTFSFTTEYSTWKSENVSFHDFLELHCWMTHWCDFYHQVGYNYERFSPAGYNNLVKNGEKLYREKPEFWKGKLKKGIELLAEWSKFSGKPLMTTECWGIVDYKDWPLLKWDWIRELCAFGTEAAAETGRWIGMATSNFCGPQFVGMWRDIDWHRRLTDIIHNARVDDDLKDKIWF